MQNEMLAEYDLSKLKGRVRGKYAERCREAIVIERADERTRTLTPERCGGFGVDVEGIDLEVSTQEIVESWFAKGVKTVHQKRTGVQTVQPSETATA